ncbi:MAG: hypothetical protein AAGG75_00225 [Bacteroidota bacterium]
MRKPLAFLGGAVFVFSLLLSSCQSFEEVGQIDEVNWNGEFALPLAFGTLSMQDILDEVGDLSFLEINSDGTMQLIFEGDEITKQSSEVLGSFPDFPVVIPENSFSIPFPNYGAISIDELSLKTGTLAFEIRSQYTSDINFTITIPNLERDGVPFSISSTVPYNGSLPAVGRIDPVDLSGYVLDVSSDSLSLEYSATLDGQDVEVGLITGLAENWTYETVTGSWARQQFPLAVDSVEMDIYDNWVDGDLSFADPRLILTIDNSFGFPSEAIIHSLMVRTLDNRLIPLESSALRNGVSLDYPTINEQGQSKQTTIVLDRNNSNIDEILNAQPIQIVYRVDAVVNPDNNSEVGFVSDQSAITVTLDAEVPVYGAAQDFTLESTSDLSIDEVDDIESAELKVTSSNGIPVDLDLQIYLADASGQVIDSLFFISHDLLPAAQVDDNGDVTAASDKVEFFEIPRGLIDLLIYADQIIFHASFSTYNDGQEAVRLLSTQALDINLGIKVKTQ